MTVSHMVSRRAFLEVAVNQGSTSERVVNDLYPVSRLTLVSFGEGARKNKV